MSTQAARFVLVHRCTVQRRPVASEDPYGGTVYGEWEDHLAALPSKWWMEIGRGEILDADREIVEDLSRMLVPADADVVESDRIVRIRDRRGRELSARTWGIQAIVPRISEGMKLLLLRAVT